MTNDFGVTIKDAWSYRFKRFFGLNDSKVVYRIFKILSIIVFTIPFVIFSVLEFVILTGFKFIGFALAFVFSILHLGFIWNLISYVFGFFYIVLTHIFWVLWLVCNIVDAINDKDAGYPYSKKENRD